MKKIVLILCIIGVTASFANGGDCDKKEGKKHDRIPPKEAIEVCVNKAAESSCQVTGRHGDILNGTCKYTPDEKYFACKPQRKKR